MTDAIEAKTRGVLASILAATNHVLYASAKSMAGVVAEGLVVTNTGMVDGKGNPANALTEFGFNYLNSAEGTDLATVAGDKTAPYAIPEGNPGAAPANTPAPVVSGDNVLVGRKGATFARARIVLPKTANTGRHSNYPTDDLLPPDEGGNLDGFFLEPNEKIKDASKAYPAVASAANKRWKDATPPRKFTSRVMDGAPFGKPGVQGVGIFRTE